MFGPSNMSREENSFCEQSSNSNSVFTIPTVDDKAGPCVTDNNTSDGRCFRCIKPITELAVNTLRYCISRVCEPGKEP